MGPAHWPIARQADLLIQVCWWILTMAARGVGILVVIACAMYAVTKISVRGVRRSNCLVFALEQLWHRGGYLVLMKSNYGWWPHAVWSADLKAFEEFCPPTKRRRWCPPVIFRGRVRPWSQRDHEARVTAPD